ncbi:MAG: hypothetical protein ACI4J2_01475 [Ruminococcus sp.]
MYIPTYLSLAEMPRAAIVTDYGMYVNQILRRSRYGKHRKVKRGKSRR